MLNFTFRKNCFVNLKLWSVLFGTSLSWGETEGDKQNNFTDAVRTPRYQIANGPMCTVVGTNVDSLENYLYLWRLAIVVRSVINNCIYFVSSVPQGLNGH